jgi:glutamate synthase domain-containing protein 1
MHDGVWFEAIQNPYGDDKVMAACGLFGILDTSGRPMAASDIVRAMANMHDRSNGLGGGFAAYGIYPEHADLYALHIMYMRDDARPQAEAILRDRFTIARAEPVPTRSTARLSNPPDFWRYFVSPQGDHRQGPDDDYVIQQVMRVNTGVPGAFVFSSGKDMAVFKGVGYPEDIAEHFRLDDYRGYMWVGHGRFPTNTPGWWGGAHPFNILDWTVVHNGEISSYGTNVRYLEMFGYHCTMQTDTEVVAYAVDLLVRRHGLPVELAADVLAPPLLERHRARGSGDPGRAASPAPGLREPPAQRPLHRHHRPPGGDDRSHRPHPAPAVDGSHQGRPALPILRGGVHPARLA